MCDITAPLMGDFKAWRRERIPIRKATGERTSKCRYSDNTMAMTIVFIKAVFRYAYSRGYVRKEAIDEIKTIPKSKITQKPVRAFSDYELKTIFASELHDNVKFCLRGLLFLGRRLGELMKIEWQHVDMEGRTIRIYGHKSVSRHCCSVLKFL
jgi:integrase